MEQVQIVLAHLKVHRFWYSLGLAALLAVLVTGGTGALKQQVQTLTNQLENSWKDINNFKSGPHPNNEWKAAVDDRKGLLDKDYTATHEQLYLEQEKLFTWPEVVNDKFYGRPFGGDLSDEGNKYIFEYKRECDDLFPIARTFYQLNVLHKRDDGKLAGSIDFGATPSQAMLTFVTFPQFETEPNSMECWLAQELLWIQSALVRSIREVNRPVEETFDINAKDYDGTKPWIQIPIKRVFRIGIGESAMSQPLLAGPNKELKEYPPPAGADGQPAAATTTGSSAKNLIPNRYLEINDQYRLIPVSVHMLIDQDKITQVLAGLANTDLNFVIHETRLTYPQEKVELPVLLQETGLSMPGRGAENPLYNCIELDVYGSMRIYEMPAAMRPNRKLGLAAARSGETPAPTAGDATKAPEGEKKEPDASKSAEAPKQPDPPPAKTPEPRKTPEPTKEPEAKKEPAKAPDAGKETPKQPEKKPADPPADDPKKSPEPPADPTKSAGKK